MNLLFPLLIGLFLSGTTAIIRNPGLPKWLRYTAMAMVIFFYIAAAFVLTCVGLAVVGDNKPLGILLLSLGAATAVLLLLKIKGDFTR